MKNTYLSLIFATLVLLLCIGCVPVNTQNLPYPTFTPIEGFQVFSLGTPFAPRTNTPRSTTPQTPTSTTTIVPEELPTETPAPEDVVNENNQPEITMIFTGQIVPARCVQAETERLGQADYIYENIYSLLRDADLTIGTLNAALTTIPPTTGCVETLNLVGRPLHADAMASAGYDVMSVSSNHIKNCGVVNCGDKAFYETLDNLNRVGIAPVGAGENLSAALAPIIFEISGITFGFVSLGNIEPSAFAGNNNPGIAVLTEENLRSAIAAIRDEVDVVIFLPHWGPEYSHLPNPSQVSFAQIAINAGADLIVGNHTHYIQSFVFIKQTPVYFGLGNLVFDQVQEPQRQQSLVLRVTFKGSEIVTTEVIPVVNEQTGKVRIANQREAVEILTNIRQINLQVQEDFN